MSKVEYYVSDGINKVGPLSIEEIKKLVFNSQISITDFIFDPRDNKMYPLLQHEAFGGDGNVSIGTAEGYSETQAGTRTSSLDFSSLRSGKNILQSPKISSRERRASTAHSNSSPEATISGVSTVAVEPQIKIQRSSDFYVQVNGKEFGPVKFLMLLSLLKQNKIKTDTPARTASHNTWAQLKNYLPAEYNSTINITPLVSNEVLPKTHWKRKNLRIDYDEVVLIRNAKYDVVAKALDLSAEAIAILWVYDIPIGEELELSLFDAEQKLLKITGKISRIEPVANKEEMPLFKAVIVFNEKIAIRNFVKL